MSYRYPACLILCFSSIGSALAQPSSIDVSLEMSTDGTTWASATPGLVGISTSAAHFRAVITPAGGGDPAITNVISESFPTGAGSVAVYLIRSDDLANWASISAGPESVDPKAFIRIESMGAMSLVPAGTFMMGSDLAEPWSYPDEPEHEVTLTRSIYVQQTEVTKAQWDEVRAQGPSLGYTDLSVGRNGFEGDFSGQHPVTEVTWNNAVKWLNLLSELHGLTPCYTVGGDVMRTGFSTPDPDFDASGYRLPTEAEWEYACRAGTTTAFYSGPITQIGLSPVDPNLDLIGWYGGNENNNTHPVGEKQPNSWGLYDAAGNVWEWCWDRYDTDYYGEGPGIDPEGPTTGFNRVIRGGAFIAWATECRSAYRFSLGPELGAYSIGFRPVRTLVP